MTDLKQMLAQHWHCSTSRLQRWRSLNCGPAYLIIGGKVLYRLEDIRAHEAASLVKTRAEFPQPPRVPQLRSPHQIVESNETAHPRGQVFSFDVVDDITYARREQAETLVLFEVIVAVSQPVLERERRHSLKF